MQKSILSFHFVGSRYGTEGVRLGLNIQAIPSSTHIHLFLVIGPVLSKWILSYTERLLLNNLCPCLLRTNSGNIVL